MTLGVRGQFSSCVFDRPFGAQDLLGASFVGCYFDKAITPPGNADQALAFTDCLVRDVSSPGPSFVPPTATLANCHFIVDSFANNPHYIVNNSNFAQTFDSILFECTDADGQGDCFSMTGSPSGGAAYTIRNCLLLPNAYGDDAGTLTSITGGFNGSTVDVQHNTYYAGSQGGNYGETGENSAGTIAAWKNNIAWDDTPGSPRGHVLQDVGHITSSSGLVTDVASPANADYNCGYNLQATYASATWFTNQGKGYQGAFSATPGAHDLATNPNFVDSTRNAATFDSAYLGNAPGAWSAQANGHVFNPGDVASDSSLAYYNGAVINYRCILAHSKSASTRPAASGWRVYWEFAGYERLRQAIFAGSTITDSALGLTNADYLTALRAWIRAGFAPKNASLKNAGSDGADIGAVPVAASASKTGLLLLNVG